MKKTIFTLLLFIGMSISSYSTTWYLDISTGFPRSGACYDPSSCDGVGFNNVMTPEDPRSFLSCDPYSHFAYLHNCPISLCYNPVLDVCDYCMSVTQYYPGFDWNCL